MRNKWKRKRKNSAQCASKNVLLDLFLHCRARGLPSPGFFATGEKSLAVRQDNSNGSSFGRCEFSPWQNSRWGQAPHPTVSGKANKHKGKSGASPHNLQNLRDTRRAEQGRADNGLCRKLLHMILPGAGHTNTSRFTIRPKRWNVLTKDKQQKQKFGKL